jgi:hypothetical protein
MRRRLVILAAAFAAAAFPALAASSLSATLGRRGACFARTYDTAHLRTHPRQTVRVFFLGDAGPAWRSTVERGQFAVSFGFRLVGRPLDVYAGTAMCRASGGGATCDIEGDGGTFSVVPNGAGLRVTVQRMELEGEHDFSPDIARADNRVMLLQPAAPSHCAQP